MAEDETKPRVRVELELPQDQVSLETEQTSKGTKPRLVIKPAEKNESPIKEATGYEVGEILTAPLQPLLHWSVRLLWPLEL